MGNEKICIASKTVELAESATYLEMTNRLCYYDAPNANGVMLPSDGAKERAETLVDMPVVARYRVNAKGEPDLGGHECYINPVTGEVEYHTENIGTHMAVEVRDDEVYINGEKHTLPCLFAKCRIWARNKNVVSAVKRLFSEGKLFSSWEILSYKYEYENGVKTLSDYAFEANCLLGTGYEPAYGTNACALEVASENPEVIIASALVADVAEREDTMKKIDVEKERIDAEAEASVAEQDFVISQEEPVEQTPAEEPEVDDADGEHESSALTMEDLYRRIEQACRSKVRGFYLWVVFPEDHVAWGRDSNGGDNLYTDLLAFTYTVEGDYVTVGEPEPVTLSVSPRDVNAAIAERDSAIAEANQMVNDLREQVAQLAPYKEEHERAEREKAEQERLAKREALNEKLTKSNLFSADELSSDRVVELLDNLDAVGVNSMIAERYLEKIQNDSASSSEQETSSKKQLEVAAVVGADSEATFVDFMATLLNNK